MTRAIFAIPGDKDQRTGGYIYDATVLHLLNESGCAVAHLELPGTFPSPPPEDMATALAALAAIPADCPVIVDGLALGAMPPDAIGQLQAPIIAMVHHPLGLETGLDRERADALIRNEKAVLQHAAHVIVPSPHIAQTLVSDFGVPQSRITVASPGQDSMEPKRAPVSPPLILSVGLLAPRKGHDVLIEALHCCADLPWQAEIIGRPQDPTYVSALNAQIARTGLGDRITLAGECHASELQAAYSRASIFALATRYEGYGMVFNEAMSHHLPIVSCAVGAVPGTVGEAGKLVPPDDPTAFAKALRTLLDDRQEAARAARASATRAARLPSWQDTRRQFEMIIASVSA